VGYSGDAGNERTRREDDRLGLDQTTGMMAVRVEQHGERQASGQGQPTCGVRPGDAYERTAKMREGSMNSVSKCKFEEPVWCAFLCRHLTSLEPVSR
jgi:hypothetical protein